MKSDAVKYADDLPFEPPRIFKIWVRYGITWKPEMSHTLWDEAKKTCDHWKARGHDVVCFAYDTDHTVEFGSKKHPDEPVYVEIGRDDYLGKCDNYHF